MTAEDMQCNAKVDEVHGYVAEFSEGNEQLGCMMLRILDDIEKTRPHLWAGTFRQSLRI